MNKTLSYLLFTITVIFFIACNSADVQVLNQSKPHYNKDLDSIKSDNVLKVFINYSPTSYFLYKGIPMGFEYDLLKKYTEHIDVNLEVIPIKNMDSVFVDLNNGKADFVAANLTITQERLKRVSFTGAINITQQVLVQRKPENWRKMRKSELKKHLMHSSLDLIDKRVTVRKGSSFYLRLKNLSNEIGGKVIIDIADGELSSDDLIEKVATQEIDYTVSDKNLALVNQWQYPNVDVSLTISSDQKIALAARKGSSNLVNSFNKWLIEYQKSVKFKMLYNKYYKSKNLFKKHTKNEYYTLKSGKISPFDEILKKHSPTINWDWRLLASMIYQESHFNNKARGWGDSFGLMQFMPKTGAKFGVDTTSSAHDNIVAGVKYIKYLDNYWEPIIPDTLQRIKFVLASYNVGPGHLLDARRLAEKYGKDPFVWDDNVDYFLLNKSKAKYYKDEVVRHGYCKGYITYDYVFEIMARYEHYKNITQEQELAVNKNY